MEDDSGWVFDSLICFLNGPVWNAPLQSFIEEKSLVFEPNVAESPEYQKVFDEFKNLVDFMLGNFMEDIGISPTQFEDACHRGGREGLPVSFDQNLFELIWAANDYGMFKRMMTQRNVELQLQALELIEQKYGITPQSFIPKGKEDRHNTVRVNTEITTHQPVKLEQEIMEEIVQTFPNLQVEDEPEEAKYIQEEKTVLKEKLKNIGKTVSFKEEATSIPDLDEITSDNIENEIKNETKQDITKEELSFGKQPKTNVDAIELKKRQEYLKAQRDKLVALKKEARKKHLAQDIVADPKENIRKRPKSAKAAGDILAGSSTSTNINPEKLQFRRALVEKLKSEVMNKTDETF